MNKRLVGFTFIVASCILALYNITITGAVIGPPISGYFSLVAIGFFVAGVVIIFQEARTSEGLSKLVFEEVKSPKGQPVDYNVVSRLFDSYGLTKLSDFSREYFSADPKTRGEYRQIFTDELLDAKEDGDKRTSSIAVKFLNVLYGNKIPKREVPLAPLSSEEEKEIKEAFRGGWNGTPNNRQDNILKKYDLGHNSEKNSQGHNKGVYVEKNPSIAKETSSTPGDRNAGKAVGRDVIALAKIARDIKLGKQA